LKKYPLSYQKSINHFGVIFLIIFLSKGQQITNLEIIYCRYKLKKLYINLKNIVEIIKMNKGLKNNGALLTCACLKKCMINIVVPSPRQYATKPAEKYVLEPRFRLMMIGTKRI